MSMPEKIKKYLSKQDSGKWTLETNNSKKYNNVIVIPAIKEHQNINNLINSLLANNNKHFPDTLLIFIINNAVSEINKTKLDNEKSILYLRDLISEGNNSPNIGLIDASSIGKELPDKNGGVGYARKIGMDIALTRFNYSSKQKHILICLDADCLVSSNYLDTIVDEFNSFNYSAAVINYKHQLTDNPEQNKAIINYELYLRYYVLSLKYANSKFGFHSIGSTIVCDAESYVRVGGMNKSKAGEDFYFLEKLAKVTSINEICGTTVFPASRTSDRVPFGTGARITRYLKNSEDEYSIYSFKCFVTLKQWLKLFNSFSPDKSTLDRLLKDARMININLYNFLVEQNFEADWNNILLNTKSEKQFSNQTINWMDGFRTLKLIHYLRDNAFSNENMFTAINKLLKACNIKFKIYSNEDIPSLEIQIKYLDLLRSLSCPQV